MCRVIKRQVMIQNKLGLHARASARLAAEASRWNSHVEIEYQDYKVNAKSIMGLMMLAAAQGAVITLMVDGEDALQAADALEKLIQDKFGEQA